MGDFLQKAPFKNWQKQMKMTSNIPFALLPNNNNTKMYSCILISWENGIPLNKTFHSTKRKNFHRLKRTAHATACSSHCCEGKDIWDLIMTRTQF